MQVWSSKILKEENVNMLLTLPFLNIGYLQTRLQQVQDQRQLKTGFSENCLKCLYSGLLIKQRLICLRYHMGRPELTFHYTNLKHILSSSRWKAVLYLQEGSPKTSFFLKQWAQTDLWQKADNYSCENRISWS